MADGVTVADGVAEGVTVLVGDGVTDALGVTVLVGVGVGVGVEEAVTVTDGVGVFVGVSDGVGVGVGHMICSPLYRHGRGGPPSGPQLDPKS